MSPHALCVRCPPRPEGGFTLIELLVALSIMAVISALAWRGIDGMARSREISQASTDRSLRLATALAQWERDLQAVQAGTGVPAIGFDGASLRLTRQVEGGVQLVVWTLREGAWWRWASPPATRLAELQDHWLRSQQLLGHERGTLRVLEGLSGWQVYFYRGNGWSNPQSKGDAGGTPNPALPGHDAPPAGVRLQLNLPAGRLTRDVLLNAGSEG